MQILFSRPPSYELLQTGSETSNENKLLTDVLKQNIYTQIHKHKYFISAQSFVFVSTVFARILKARLYAQVITKLFTQHFPPVPHSHIHTLKTHSSSPLQELEVGLLSPQTGTSGWKWIWGDGPRSLPWPHRDATAALIGSRVTCWCLVTLGTTGDNIDRRTAQG